MSCRSALQRPVLDIRTLDYAVFCVLTVLVTAVDCLAFGGTEIEISALGLAFLRFFTVFLSHAMQSPV